MTDKSLRILMQIDFPGGQTVRLWDGAGPYLDYRDGTLWLGDALMTGLDALEAAINGDAADVNMTLSGVATETDGKIWAFYIAGNLIDAKVRVMIQRCDALDQPVGSRRNVWWGRIDNAAWEDGATEEGVMATLTVTLGNLFSLRRAINGATLSDVDQRARAAILNPAAPPDRYAERVPGIQVKTIPWPVYS